MLLAAIKPVRLVMCPQLRNFSVLVSTKCCCCYAQVDEAAFNLLTVPYNETTAGLCSINCHIHVLTGNGSACLQVLASSLLAISAITGNKPQEAVYRFKKRTGHCKQKEVMPSIRLIVTITRPA